MLLTRNRSNKKRSEYEYTHIFVGTPPCAYQHNVLYEKVVARLDSKVKVDNRAECKSSGKQKSPVHENIYLLLTKGCRIVMHYLKFMTSIFRLCIYLA